MKILPARPEDHVGAVGVWHAANMARGVVPSSERIERVRQKLMDADAVALVGWLEGEVQAMVLAEPWRHADGTGSVVANHGHVSMVVVDPNHWGQRLGTSILAGLHQTAQQRGWTCTSLWTRETNERAQRLYRGAQYQPTGRSDELPTCERVLEFQRDLET